MKKILSILLAGAMCLGLAACGGSPAGKAAAVPTADTSALAAPEQTYISAPMTLPEGVTEPTAAAAEGDTVYLCAGAALYSLDSGGTVTGSVDLAVDEGAVAAMAPAGDGTLWLMTVLQPTNGAQPTSAVCRLDPEQGQVLAAFDLPTASASADMCSDGEARRLYISASAELLVLDWDGNELARLPGQVYDLALAADGTVCALDQQPDGAYLLTLDLDGQRWERVLAFDSQDVGLYSGGQGHGLLAEVDGTLCGLAPDTAAFTPLLDLAAANVTMLSAAFPLADGAFLLKDQYSPALYMARPGEAGSGPETVTLAVFGAGMLTPAVTAFNNSQDAYRVVLKDYSYDEQTGAYLDYYDTAGLAQLGLDIASGEGPDILALDAAPVYQYIKDGLLEDLYPYIDADPDIGREDLDGTLLAALETEGALYELAPVAQLRTLIAAPGALDGVELAWSALLERFDQDAFAGEGGSGLLEAGVCGDGSPFVDWEKGVCDFENDEFLALLALAKGAEQPAESGGAALLVRSVFGGAALAQNAGELGLAGQVPALRGLPGREGERYLLSPLMDFGILAQSEHKDGAWAFLRTLLTEPNGMWLGHFLAKDAGADAPAPEGLSAEELAQLDQAADAAFSAAGGVFHRDMYVAAILREETAPYFAGQAGAEDAASAIQNRVSLYLSERQ